MNMNNIIKGLGRLATPTSQQAFKGCFLTPLNKSGRVTVNHHLDKDIQEYYRVINEIIVPDSAEITHDAKSYAERMRKVMSYNTPVFSDCWNYAIELQYRMVAPPEHQTEENLTKMRILRACMDITWAMAGVSDDIVDKAEGRVGKPAWYTFCEGGSWGAMYDAIVMSYVPFYILRKRFKNDPSYGSLQNVFAIATLKMIIGQNMDYLAQHVTKPDALEHAALVKYKVAHLWEAQPAVGLLHAGITDENIINQVMEIYFNFGLSFQLWDDFNDYYTIPKASGKPECDFKNGATTWLSVIAMDHLDSNQMSIFKDCYGSDNPEKIEEVKKIFDEINMPLIYLKKMRENYVKIDQMIKKVPNPKIQNACYSQLEWMLGDLKEPIYS